MSIGDGTNCTIPRSSRRMAIYVGTYHIRQVRRAEMIRAFDGEVPVHQVPSRTRLPPLGVSPVFRRLWIVLETPALFINRRTCLGYRRSNATIWSLRRPSYRSACLTHFGTPPPRDRPPQPAIPAITSSAPAQRYPTETPAPAGTTFLPSWIHPCTPLLFRCVHESRSFPIYLLRKSNSILTGSCTCMDSLRYLNQFFTMCSAHSEQRGSTNGNVSDSSVR